MGKTKNRVIFKNYSMKQINKKTKNNRTKRQYFIGGEGKKTKEEEENIKKWIGYNIKDKDQYPYTSKIVDLFHEQAKHLKSHGDKKNFRKVNVSLYENKYNYLKNFYENVLKTNILQNMEDYKKRAEDIRYYGEDLSTYGEVIDEIPGRYKSTTISDDEKEALLEKISKVESLFEEIRQEFDRISEYKEKYYLYESTKFNYDELIKKIRNMQNFILIDSSFGKSKELLNECFNNKIATDKNEKKEEEEDEETKLKHLSRVNENNFFIEIHKLKNKLTEEQIKQINDVLADHQESDISKAIETELRKLIKTLRLCGEVLPKKEKIMYDDSLTSRLVTTLRDLISQKYSNWQTRSNLSSRNDLIFKALQLLVSGNYTNDKYLKGQRGMAQGLGHALSIHFTNPGLFSEIIVPLQLAYTTAMIPLTKIIELRNVVYKRDADLLVELQILHEELKKFCKEKK